jgi:hypothetical protein
LFVDDAAAFPFVVNGRLDPASSVAFRVS